MTEPREPVQRWMVKATFPTSGIGELTMRNRQLARAAGRSPKFTEDATFAMGQGKASAEWHLETMAEAKRLEEVIRTKASPEISDLSVYSREIERVLRPEEFQVSAQNLRDGRAVCVRCGEAVRAVVPANVPAGTVLPSRCRTCDFLNDWIIAS